LEKFISRKVRLSDELVILVVNVEFSINRSQADHTSGLPKILVLPWSVELLDVRPVTQIPIKGYFFAI